MEELISAGIVSSFVVGIFGLMLIVSPLFIWHHIHFFRVENERHLNELKKEAEKTNKLLAFIANELTKLNA